MQNCIKELRQARRLSQQALGDHVGATRQTINAIEQGKYAPSLELAFRISAEFAVPFEDVFSFDPDG
ncbi:MAG: transcriptional regulator [Parvularculaceae bacterium]|nr:MAG: transcriptional regulator [Parvularculaceae bacterium]